MVYFIYNEFGILVNDSTISRALKSRNWSRKKVNRRAKQRSRQLRELYFLKLSRWTAEQLIFVDESSCNERSADRKYGWAPIGQAPIVYSSLHRSQRWSILPAYTIDGYVAWHMQTGHYTSAQFLKFVVEDLLPKTNPFPGKRSILIMDNAKIHDSEVKNPTFIVESSR